MEKHGRVLIDGLKIDNWQFYKWKVDWFSQQIQQVLGFRNMTKVSFLEKKSLNVSVIYLCM